MTYAQWQDERRSALTSPTGNLALVGYQPVNGFQPEPISGIPASVALSPDGRGVFITAAAHNGVSIAGKIIDGTVFVNRLQPDGTPVVRWGRHCLDVFSLDGTDYELRIYDSQAPTIMNFDHVEYYPEDPRLVSHGSYRAYSERKDLAWDFTRTSDSGHTKHVPGIIDIAIGVEQYGLLAFLDGPMLVVVFSDETTGTESYAPGRFLRVAPPEAGGALTLDFNRAFIPPCGFSDYYSCPIPPRENQIASPIRGGEKRVHWRPLD
jgi:uncharacterized protein (DUF1684 family)